MSAKSHIRKHSEESVLISVKLGGGGGGGMCE